MSIVFNFNILSNIRIKTNYKEYIVNYSLNDKELF